jgi:hypothetical protein
MPEGASSSATVHPLAYILLKRRGGHTSLRINLILLSIRSITSNHLLILANSNTFPLHNLHIVQSRKYLMLNLEFSDHRELSSFLDLKGLILQGVLGSFGGEVYGDGWAPFGFHGKGEYDAVAGVVWIGDVFSAAEAQGGFVSLHGFIVGV